MIIRARAPLRLGLSGGGTDLSPYCDRFGGCVLNATIDMYAYAMVEPDAGDRVRFVAKDVGVEAEFPADPAAIPLEDPLGLHRAVYRRIVDRFTGGRPVPCTLTTFCEAPPGSGLGSSSTLVVAMIKAFAELLSLPLGDYEMAQLAFEIERRDFGLEGGKQDQYAATFGGFNFMEFYAEDRVIVNPLRIKNWILSEMEASTVLYYTGVSRASAEIIKDQVANVKNVDQRSLDAMHEMKADTTGMKNCILTGDIDGFAGFMRKSWDAKKRTAKLVSNAMIDGVYERAIAAGARAGKISGAGGGGFMTFIVDPLRRTEVIRALGDEDGQVMNVHFTKNGTQGWRID